jgi:hypothetical protein
MKPSLSRLLTTIPGSVVLGLLLAGCATPALRVERTQFGGSIWSEGQRRAGVLFQDGSQAIAVDGGTLWSFGDTFWGDPQPGQPPRNSQIRGAHCATLGFLPAGATNLPPALSYYTNADGRAANPLALLPGEDEKHRRLWPTGAVLAGPHIYLYYSVIETTEAPGPWNFHGVGGGLAVADKPLSPFRRLQPEGDWKFPVEPMQAVRENGVLYLLEVSTKPRGLLLARVAEAQIEHPQAYEFYTGVGWSKERAQAKVVLSEAYGQVSVMRMPRAGGYLMATSSDFYHPREIQLRRAARLEGPWSAPVRIAVPEMASKKTQLVYCAFLHPELSDADSGSVVVTFCRILEGNWELTNPEWAVFKLAL